MRGGLSSGRTVPISKNMLSLLSVSDVLSAVLVVAAARENVAVLPHRARKLQLLPMLAFSAQLPSYACVAMKLTLSSKRTRSDMQSSPVVTQLQESLPFAV